MYLSHIRYFHVKRCTLSPQMERYTYLPSKHSCYNMSEIIHEPNELMTLVK